MDNSLFGWELLTKLIESDVKNAMDLVVALVHWQMVKLSFVCLGTGDDKTIRDSDCGSEKLPEYWNEDCGHYSLRYSLGGCGVYILKCVIIDGSTALFNLYNVSNGTVSHLSFELKEVIACGGDAQRKKLSEMVQKIDVQVIRIREELILPVAGCFNCTNDTMPRPPDPKSTQRSLTVFRIRDVGISLLGN